MKSKKLIMSLLAVTVLLGSAVSTVAEVDARKVLTFESSVKSAQDYSIQIRKNSRNVELYQQQIRDLYNLGTIGKSYSQLVLQKESIEKSTEAEKKAIAYQIGSLFDNILYNEKDLSQSMKEIEIQNKNLRKLSLAVEKGLKSSLDLETLKLQIKQLEDKKTALENTIKQQYMQLNGLMGNKSNNTYILEKILPTYEPIKISGTLEGYIRSKASKHLGVWQAEQQIDVAKMIDMDKLQSSGGSYTVYLGEKMQGPNAEDSKEELQLAIESSLRQQYDNVIQLENTYDTLVAQLKVEEKNLVKAQLLHEKGLIAKLDLETANLAYEKVRLQLENVIIKHEQLKTAIEDPNVAGSSLKTQ